MSESDPLLLGQILYYGREKLYNHVLNVCEDGLRKFVNDPVLQLYLGVAKALQGQTHEAVRALEDVSDQADASLAALNAMLYAHNNAKHIDRDAVSTVENKIKDVRKIADDTALYHNCVFLVFTNKADKAKDMADKICKSYANNPWYLSIKGWIDLQASRDMKSALHTFETAAKEPSANEGKCFEPYLGQAKYHESRQNFTGMLEALRPAIAQSPNFLPLQIEKMRAQFMGRQWDQCQETASRCQTINQDCIIAQQYAVIHAMSIETRLSEAGNLLGDLVQMLNQKEPQNAEFYIFNAQLFSRICGRNEGILRHTKAMSESAVNLSHSAESIEEQGRQMRMLAEYKAASKFYKQAMEKETIDSAKILLGLVSCCIAEGKFDEAQGQLEFAIAAHEHVANSLMTRYLQAILMKHQHKNRKDVTAKLVSVVNEHIASVSKHPFNIQYFVDFDPDFVLDVVNELMSFISPEPAKATNLADPLLKDIVRMLNSVSELVPGLTESLYLLGKARYLSGEIDLAQTTLQKCLSKDQTYSDAHLLMAQIFLQKQQFKQASQSLEVGLSYNFEVRDHPLYHLIKARIMKRSKNIEGSLQQLKSAMALNNFKRGGRGAVDSKPNKSRLELTEGDRVSVYLELIDSLQALNKSEEASKLMQEALKEFSGTKEEQQLIICNADLALNRGDMDGALDLLKQVPADQPNYLAARQKMAEIYLHHKKDKRQFALCYKDLVDRNPTPQAYVLLGDAYMSIQEPERAIEVYEAALKKNPKDHALARKIGQAYVRAHLYSKAVNYYEAALKSGQQIFLRLDLAELLFKLKNYEKCERILKIGIEGKSGDAGSMDQVQFRMLLANVYFETGNWEQAIQMLDQAKELQSQVVKRPPVEVIDIHEQRKIASNICAELAQYFENQRDLDKAIELYKEALTYTENDSKRLLSLAHLYLVSGKLDECNQHCQLLLRIDKENDQATLMLADLMYQRNETDAAMFHFQQLLDRNPSQYHALARLIELTSRSADVEQSEKYLKATVDKNARASLDAGFNYCKGLFEWYTGDPNGALQHFNRARRDLEWGERSIYNMIEICLNPDNEIIGGEVFNSQADPSATSDQEDAHEMGVRTAEKFLKELHFKPGLDYKYKLMESFILLATKNKANVDQALQNFTDLAGDFEQQESGNIGAVLGLSRAYMLTKQLPKSKALLKKVVQVTWSLDDADYLQQCWLLLADIYINQAKYDSATDILNVCLQHNVSCLKAFECLGYISEKEQRWADASTNYEQAWKLTRRRNPTIGYKLGVNYLKSKKLVEAIDTCHRVLELYPNYPKIKKDILDKARANLRI